jgi:hypothetical protein
LYFNDGDLNREGTPTILGPGIENSQILSWSSRGNFGKRENLRLLLHAFVLGSSLLVYEFSWAIMAVMQKNALFGWRKGVRRWLVVSIEGVKFGALSKRLR